MLSSLTALRLRPPFPASPPPSLLFRPFLRPASANTFTTLSTPMRSTTLRPLPHIQPLPQPHQGWSMNGTLLQQTRGSKHPSYGGKKLPGYILPKLRERTSGLKQKLKMKWFRMKIGKTGQRPRRPRYGRDDFILSKMNL
ncbi:uncharacterized protein EV422DRAFT_531441 [Fimicolochytrium jonesii]|uniref:uncharacterized protein n=1 Tax=Fimicolochytrium jonesii TaxID=1396493 RepID=UPI0022FE36A2|nr:uncharacterized protein EV422DRAFT_531441 [Fimicolochytrium jonesii]KAI8820573.1 hypothetical protein EV422DRAFT_531441 [Fimicolochytrium jonesii]